LEGFSKKAEGDTKEVAMAEKIKTWIGSVKYVASGYGCSFDDVLKWNFDRFLVFYNFLIDEQKEINKKLRQK
jgi:uncharacterized membrane-anchored protein